MNGGWSGWGSWLSCSTSGKKARTRECNNPTPINAGNSCSGLNTETANCAGK